MLFFNTTTMNEGRASKLRVCSDCGESFVFVLSAIHRVSGVWCEVGGDGCVRFVCFRRRYQRNKSETTVALVVVVLVAVTLPADLVVAVVVAVVVVSDSSVSLAIDEDSSGSSLLSADDSLGIDESSKSALPSKQTIQ